MSVLESIEQKLQGAFAPDFLRVINDSGAHAGHAGNPGGDAVSHVGILIVSETFAGKSRIERHRAVHSAIADEIKLIHAITMLKPLTKEEYANLPKTIS